MQLKDVNKTGKGSILLLGNHGCGKTRQIKEGLKTEKQDFVVIDSHGEYANTKGALVIPDFSVNPFLIVTEKESGKFFVSLLECMGAKTISAEDKKTVNKILKGIYKSGDMRTEAIFNAFKDTKFKGVMDPYVDLLRGELPKQGHRIVFDNSKFDIMSLRVASLLEYQYCVSKAESSVIYIDDVNSLFASCQYFSNTYTRLTENNCTIVCATQSYTDLREKVKKFVDETEVFVLFEQSAYDMDGLKKGMKLTVKEASIINKLHARSFAVIEEKKAKSKPKPKKQPKEQEEKPEPLKENIEFTIPLQPYTKKNSSQILMNNRTGKRFVAPSANFTKYQNACAAFIKAYGIKAPVNVKAIFYMQTRRRVDLTNLNEALHDILVHYGCLEDDNSTIVVSTDGSRVRYDKENPRTEIVISPAEEE